MTRDPKVISKVNARKTSYLKRPIKVKKPELYKIDWTKGQMGQLLDGTELNSSSLFKKTLSEQKAILLKKISKIQLENDNIRNELPIEIIDNDGKEDMYLNLDNEKDLLDNLIELNKKNKIKIKELYIYIYNK